MTSKVQVDKKSLRLLPVTIEDLDAEAARYFAQIRTNLLQCLRSADLLVSIRKSLQDLIKFITVYSLRFSKENHVMLINMLVNFLTIDDLTLYDYNKIVFLLYELIKKKNLLTRNDLAIDWRILYNFYKKYNLNNRHFGQKSVFVSSINKQLEMFVRSAKKYFALEASKEIYDFLKSFVYPMDEFALMYAHKTLAIFLPVTNPIEIESDAFLHNYWLKDLMDHWAFIRTKALHEHRILCIITDLAYFNIGYIDWEPYLPFIYTKFLSSMHLPVTFDGNDKSEDCNLSINNVSIFIVFSLDVNNSSMIYFKKLMKTLETYYLPSNNGRWFGKLKTFLKKLSEFLSVRLRIEKFPKKQNKFIRIRDGHRLTDRQVDDFVNALKPAVEYSLLTRSPIEDNNYALTRLANVRPAIIVPLVLDKFYSLTDTYSEPVNLTASIISLYKISRLLVTNSEYPDGRTHVIRILNIILQWIDFNDWQRMMNVLGLISTLVKVLPLVNCSTAIEHHPELDETMQMVCNETMYFDDFIVRLFDRVFVAIECLANDSVDSTTKVSNVYNPIEMHTIDRVFDLILNILSHSDSKKHMNLLRLVLDFVDSHVFVSKIATLFLVITIEGFTKIGSPVLFEAYLQYIVTKCERFVPDLRPDDERPSPECNYYLSIFSRSISICGSQLEPFFSQCIRMAHQLMDTGNCYATKHAAILVCKLWHELGALYISDCTNFPNLQANCSDESYLFVNDWGKTYALTEVDIRWHKSNETEIQAMQRLIDEFLVPQLDVFRAVIAGQNIGRIKLRNALRITAEFFKYDFFPDWDNEPDSEFNGITVQPASLLVFQKYDFKMPDGSNIKRKFAETLHLVQKHVLSNDESDTKSLKFLCLIWSRLVLHLELEPQLADLNDRDQVFHDSLTEIKRTSRITIIGRALYTFELLTSLKTWRLTRISAQIFNDLFDLLICPYKIDQTLIKQVIVEGLVRYAGLNGVLAPRIVAALALDPNEHKDAVEGCLHLFGGDELLQQHVKIALDIDFVTSLWLALLKLPFSEELTTTIMSNKVFRTINLTFCAGQLLRNVPIACFQSILQFCGQFDPEVSMQPYLDTVSLTNSNYHRKFQFCVREILSLLKNSRLHWTFLNLGLNFLYELSFSNENFDENTTEFILECLVHDLIMIRKKAMDIFLRVSHKLKPVFRKIALAEVAMPTSFDDRCWNTTIFVHKSYIRFTNTIDSEIYVCRPADEQPRNRPADCSGNGALVFRYFSNRDYLLKLFRFLSLEGKKGAEVFSNTHMLVFKNVFKMYETIDLNVYKEIIWKLIEEPIEVNHKCAAELICGLMRGMKHWRVESIANVREIMRPIFKRILATSSTEVDKFWCTAVFLIVYNRDPLSIHWFYEIVVEFEVNELAINNIANRLTLLSNVVKFNIWKLNEWKPQILSLVRQFESHPFDMIRNKTSLLLLLLFYTQYFDLHRESELKCVPHITDFVSSLKPRLDALYLTDTCDAKTDATLLLKTLHKWVIRSLNGYPVFYVEFYQLIPYTLCVYDTKSDNDEDKFLTLMAKVIILPEHFDAIYAICTHISANFQWASKVILCKFLQLFIFQNMFILIQSSQNVLKIKLLVLALLEDEQLEVAKRAMELIKNLLHCHFFDNQEDILRDFLTKSRMKIDRANRSVAYRKKNSGILGLCAFIEAYPYTIPVFLNDVFIELSKHLSDPQPIPSIINEIIRNFNRTHKSEWETNHKFLLSEECLAILSDLITPPSYIA